MGSMPLLTVREWRSQIAVLGGNGELGSYLCLLLVEGGHAVTSVTSDELPPYLPEESAWGKVERVVLDRAALEAEAFGLFGKRVMDLRPDVVVDASCATLEHCKGLATALRGTGVQHLVHIGSAHVYSPSTPRPWTEDAPRGAACGVFAAEQQAMEAFLREEHRARNLPVTIMLLADLVGRGWTPVTPQGIHDAAVFDAIASGGKIMLPNATCCLQLVHAQDAARAVEAAIRLRDSTIGQTFNVGGAPLTPVAYVQAVAQHVYKLKGAPCIERDFLQFADALEKQKMQELRANGEDLGEWHRSVSLESADTLLRAHYMQWGKMQNALGIEPRPPVAAVADALDWLDAHPGESGRPRAQAPHAFTGGRPEFIPAAEWQGSKQGYYFRKGYRGHGYYLDHGTFVLWQMQAWRALRKQVEDEQLMGEKGDQLLRTLMWFVPASAVAWIVLLVYLFVAGETMQVLSPQEPTIGVPAVRPKYLAVFDNPLPLCWFSHPTPPWQSLVVYMHWVPGMLRIGSLPRFTPKPFTATAVVRSTAKIELGVWHTLLPRRGYNATYTPDELTAAAGRCRTVLYLHGNGETRGKQVWKLQWYHRAAKADVVTVDYRGFADSTCPTKAFSSCLTERGLYEDAFSVFQWMTNATTEGGLAIPPGCIVIHGHSLGSAVATRVAGVLSQQGKAPGGVVLESGFTSMLDVMTSSDRSPISYLPDVVGNVFRGVMSAPGRMKHPFVHKAYVKAVASPVLLLHGDKDKTCPAEMSTELFNARNAASDEEAACEDVPAGPPCTDILFLPNADHNDVMHQDDAKDKVLEFVRSVWARK